MLPFVKIITNVGLGYKDNPWSRHLADILKLKSYKVVISEVHDSLLEVVVPKSQ